MGNSTKGQKNAQNAQKNAQQNAQQNAQNAQFAFDSVLTTDEVVKGWVHATPLCRSYALRVIAAGRTNYLDKSGANVDTNVFTGTFRKRLIAVALVADYKAMCVSLKKDSTGVLWENVVERYSHIYDAWKDSLTLSGSCDFTKVKAVWDAYISAVRKEIPTMAQDILKHLSDTDAFLRGSEIPEQQDPYSPTGTSPLWEGQRPNFALGKIMAAIKFSRVNGGLKVGGTVNTTGAIFGAKQNQ